MGWWSIKDAEKPGVDFSSVVESGELANRFPGQDSPVEMYNGDGPADILSPAMHLLVDALFHQMGIKPSFEFVSAQIEKYLDGEFPVGSLYHRYLSQPYDEVRKEYRDAWGREPFRDELIAVARFVLGGCDLPRK